MPILIISTFFYTFPLFLNQYSFLNNNFHSFHIAIDLVYNLGVDHTCKPRSCTVKTGGASEDEVHATYY